MRNEDDELPVQRPQNGAAASQATQSRKAGDTPVLNSFGFDMTQAAEEGKLDPVVAARRKLSDWRKS